MIIKEKRKVTLFANAAGKGEKEQIIPSRSAMFLLFYFTE